MPTYKYIAKTKDGKTVSNFVELSDRAAVISMLREKELFIISIDEKKERAKQELTFFQKKIKLDDLVIFSRQLATMVDAGIPLVGALDILGDQVENPTFRKVIVNIKEKVETGSSLSEALAKHSKVFSSLFINMVKAGESSGMLDDILDRLAAYLEKTSALQRKVKSALIYPAVITVMAILITLVLLIKVIPVFKDIYSGFGAALPKPTQLLINVSNAIVHYFLLIFLITGGVIFAIYSYTRTERGRTIFDAITLKLPVFGVLLRKVAVSKFTRTLSTLVRSGVPILSSLEIVAKTSGNKVIENAVKNVRASIKEGENIAEPLSKSKVFPPMVVRMVAVGEQTGELEKMLSKIADFYDEQVDAAVSGLTSMIEPLIIAFLGIVIGTIVICMFLPIFKISTIINV